jgi:ParB-like chromosome segregation protein Spo0J
LIAGQRRLEAVRKLGWSTIPARVVTDLSSAVERLVMERDENTVRKPMTPGELVSLGKALEELERPRALERMAEAGRSAAPGRAGQRYDQMTGPFLNKGETAHVVAPALGMSGSSYKRAKFVVNAATDPDATEEDRMRAQEALTEMNTTGTISGAFEKARDGAPGIAAEGTER